MERFIGESAALVLAKDNTPRASQSQRRSPRSSTIRGMIRTTLAIVPLMFWTAAAATAVARQTPPVRTTAIREL